MSAADYHELGGLRVAPANASRNLKFEMKLIHSDPGDSLSSVNAIEVTLRNSGTEPLTLTYRDSNRFWIGYTLHETREPLHEYLRRLIWFEVRPDRNFWGYRAFRQFERITEDLRAQRTLVLRPQQSLKYNFVVNKGVLACQRERYLPIRTGKYRIRAFLRGVHPSELKQEGKKGFVSAWQNLHVNRGLLVPRGREVLVAKWYRSSGCVKINNGKADGIRVGDKFYRYPCRFFDCPGAFFDVIQLNKQSALLKGPEGLGAYEVPDSFWLYLVKEGPEVR